MDNGYEDIDILDEIFTEIEYTNRYSKRLFNKIKKLYKKQKILKTKIEELKDFKDIYETSLQYEKLTNKPITCSGCGRTMYDKLNGYKISFCPWCGNKVEEIDTICTGGDSFDFGKII